MPQFFLDEHVETAHIFSCDILLKGKPRKMESNIAIAFWIDNARPFGQHIKNFVLKFVSIGFKLGIFNIQA